MRCDDAIGLFTRYRDGDLDPATRADLEAHLAGCARCRAEYEAIDTVRALLRELRPEPAPATLVSGVRARLRRRPERPREVLWRWALPAAAAAALVVVALGVLRVVERPRKSAAMATQATRTPFGVRIPQRGKDLARVRRNAASAKAHLEERMQSGEVPPGDMSAPIGGMTEHAPPPLTGKPRTAIAGRDASGLPEVEVQPTPAPPAQIRLGSGVAPSSPGKIAAEPTAAEAKAKVAPPSPAYSPQFPPVHDGYLKPSVVGSRSARPPAAAPPGPAGPRAPAGPTGVAGVVEPSSKLGRPSSAPGAKDESAGAVGAQDALKAGAGPPAAERPSAEGMHREALALSPQQQVSVSAQATTSQQAAGNLTLQVRTAQDIADARVAVRPARPGGRETVVWQGRLNKDISNNLDIPVTPGREVATAAPQLVVVSGLQLSPERFYLFAPRPATAPQVSKQRVFHARKSGKGIQPPAENWERTLQTLANGKGVYVLAPGGFPMHASAQVAQPLSDRDVSTALSRLGYSMSQQEGVIKVEPSARTKQPVRAGRRSR